MASAWLLLPAAWLLALAWWLRRTRGIAAALAALLAALPWLADRTSMPALALLTLVAAAALPAKLADAAVAPEVWAARRFRDWALFLALPFVVCYRARLRDPVRPRGESVRVALRGLLEAAAGAALLRWAFGREWDAAAVEYAVKLAGLYLLVLDGAFVLATGLLRLGGFAVHDLSRHPLVAVTPADFWRRYNRDAGRFLFENLYRRLPLRSLAARSLVVFAANGLLHEYLAWILAGRIRGYALGFFVLQGVAVALTARRRPTGAAAVVSWAATLLFMAASSALILAAVDCR